MCWCCNTTSNHATTHTVDCLHGLSPDHPAASTTHQPIILACCCCCASLSADRWRRAMSSRRTPQPHIATSSSRDSPRLAQQMATHEKPRLFMGRVCVQVTTIHNQQPPSACNPNHDITSAHPFCSPRLMCYITHNSNDRSVLRHSTAPARHSTARHAEEPRTARQHAEDQQQRTVHIAKACAPLTPTGEEGGSQALAVPPHTCHDGPSPTVVAHSLSTTAPDVVNAR